MIFVRVSPYSVYAQGKLAAVMLFSVEPKNTRSTFQTLHNLNDIILFSVWLQILCVFFSFFLWRRMLIAVIIHSIYHNVSTFYAGTHELFIHANPKIYIWYDENNNENVAKMRDKRKNRITGTHRILLDDLWFQTVYRTLRNVLRSIETRKFIKYHSTAISVKQNIIFLGLFCFYFDLDTSDITNHG